MSDEPEEALPPDEGKPKPPARAPRRKPPAPPPAPAASRSAPRRGPSRTGSTPARPASPVVRRGGTGAVPLAPRGRVPGPPPPKPGADVDEEVTPTDGRTGDIAAPARADTAKASSAGANSTKAGSAGADSTKPDTAKPGSAVGSAKADAAVADAALADVAKPSRRSAADPPPRRVAEPDAATPMATPSEPVVVAARTAEPAPVNGNGDGSGAGRGLAAAGATAIGDLASAGARRIGAGAKALSSGVWRAKRQQLALAPVRLGTLSPRQLDRRADVLNIRRIGKLEPGFKTWRRLWSLVVLIVIVAVIAVAVAAVLDLIITALSVAANHAISKSAGQ